jgi:hypothetical protein
MSTKTDNSSHAVEPYVGVVPEFVTTRGSAVFSTIGLVWEVREAAAKVRLNFEKLPPLSIPFLTAFQATLVWYARNASLWHFQNMFYRASDLFDSKFDITSAVIGEINAVDILNFRGLLGEVHEYKLGAVSGFLEQWHAMGYAGVTADAAHQLNQLRLKGNPKGVDVTTRHPTKGPFTDLELEALQHNLNRAYGDGDVSDAEYVLCWLFMALGQRPVQYAVLKVSDVAQSVDNDGVKTYYISVPRGKRRDSKPRKEFKVRALTPQIGKHVYRYAQKVKALFEGKLKDPNDAPLFPSVDVGVAPDGYAYHQTADEIGTMLADALNRLNAVSERTGDFIKVGAKRFRTTVGTRAAQEGHSELVIAELLDHSDTQNVGVYVKSTPEIVERIDRAMAMYMAPLAQAFAGKLIGGPAEATRAFDPASEIRAPQITKSLKCMSSCGKNGPCGFLKPIACYTCDSFEPWLDGPHEMVLDYLLSDRDRLMKDADPRIASINDRTIFAVAEVVALCEETKAAREASNG